MMLRHYALLVGSPTVLLCVACFLALFACKESSKENQARRELRALELELGQKKEELAQLTDHSLYREAMANDDGSITEALETARRDLLRLKAEAAPQAEIEKVRLEMVKLEGILESAAVAKVRLEELSPAVIELRAVISTFESRIQDLRKKLRTE